MTKDDLLEVNGRKVNLAFIEGTEVGQAVEGLNIRVVDGNGAPIVDADGKPKMTYNGSLPAEFWGEHRNRGFLSVTADELSTHKVYELIDNGSNRPPFRPPTQAADDLVDSLGIKRLPNGELTGPSWLKPMDEVRARLLHELPDGRHVGDLHDLVVNTGNAAKLGKNIGVAVVVTVALTASAASAAQQESTYDSDQANEENRQLIAGMTGAVMAVIAEALFTKMFKGIGLFRAVALGIPVSIFAEAEGRKIGEAMYDANPSAGKAIAEALAPILAPLGDAAEEIWDVIAPAVAGVMSDVLDLVLGSEGLFGANGPLFGEGAPLHFAVEVLEDPGLLLETGNWRYGAFDQILLGSDATDILVHSRWGEVRGGGGSDILVGSEPIFIKKGDPLFEGLDSPVAEKDEYLTLDGGAGDDIILTYLGQGALTIGGIGRDLIINSSLGGVIYGDTIDGLYHGQNGAVEINKEVREDRYGRVAEETSDNFWFFPNVTIMDPGHNDILTFFGFPLVGGSNQLPTMGLIGGGLLQGMNLATFWSPIYYDAFMPWIQYVQKDGNLYVVNLINSLFDAVNPSADFEELKGVMRAVNYEGPRKAYFGGEYFASVDESGRFGDEYIGDLGLMFKNINPVISLLSMIPGFPGGLNRLMPMIDDIFTKAAFAPQFVRAVGWYRGWESSGGDGDPDGGNPGGGPGNEGAASTEGLFVLDLDGDGIETVSLSDAKVWFDVDADLFGEKMGWVKGDDGLLVRDLNANGRIDDVTEMFGKAGQSGFAALGEFDANDDGVIDVADLVYSELRVWRDRDGDGVTDAGELTSLAALGIRSISVNATGLGATTPQGTWLEGRGSFTWADGRTGNAFDAVFQVDEIDTKFAGDEGKAAWLGDAPISAKGFGRIADLTVAASNDFAVRDMLAQAAASITVPNLEDMRQKSGAMLGQWGFALEKSRELAPVLLSADGKTLVDRAEWVEDQAGGYWQLKSGAPILAADGSTIARPSMQDVLAQAARSGSFSRSGRRRPVLRRCSTGITRLIW